MTAKNTEDDPRNYIVCAYWGDKHHVPCNQVECTDCGAKLAVDKKNKPMVDEGKIFPLCSVCTLRHIEDSKDGWDLRGGMIGGKRVPMSEDHKPLLEKYLKQVRKERN